MAAGHTERFPNLEFPTRVAPPVTMSLAAVIDETPVGSGCDARTRGGLLGAQKEAVGVVKGTLC